ncbi:MAG: hypothetical protein PHT30_01085 [Bacilli bacterium]|nr:hypothetical protein [Bacilli bacterium]
MKYQHPETSLVTIYGPDQTSWIGNLTLEVLFEEQVVGIIKGQKSAQFEINEDARFKIRTANTAFPKLEVEIAALFTCPTTVKLYLLGNSEQNAKLVAKTTYGERYSKRKQQ